MARPLLMENTTKNINNQKKNDDARTCFTDAYEPII